MSDPTREEIVGALARNDDDRSIADWNVIDAAARAHLRSLSAEKGGAWTEVICEPCKGTGRVPSAEDDHDWKNYICNQCHGSGKYKTAKLCTCGGATLVSASPSPIPVEDADEASIVDEALRRYLAVQGCGFELGESDRTSMRAAIAPLLAENARLKKVDDIGRSNIQNGWHALRMIREALEGATVGALPSEEATLSLKGPEPVHQAEMLVAGILDLQARATAAEAEVSRLRSALEPFIRSIYDHEVFKAEILKNKDWARLIECFRDGRDLLAALASEDPQK